MISPSHLLIVAIIAVAFFGRNKIPALGRGIGEGLREFKKGLKGEGDIDVTDSVKRVTDEGDDDKKEKR